jgi:hypothetical protein
MAKNNMNVENKEVKKASITVTEHASFDGDMKTNIVSSIDMAEIVSSLFAPAFSDYYGCKIRIHDGSNPAVMNHMPYGALYVELYFKDRGEPTEGAWKNIRVRGSDNTRTDLGARFFRVNGAATNGRAYEVTKETYEALEAFTLAGNRTRWNELTQEISTSMAIYGKEEVVVCITGIDLNKVITEIYGGKTEEGRFEYVATPSTLIPGKNQEFIMQVTQLNVKAVRDLQKDLGIYNPSAPQFHQYR